MKGLTCTLALCVLALGCVDYDAPAPVRHAKGSNVWERYGLPVDEAALEPQRFTLHIHDGQLVVFDTATADIYASDGVDWVKLANPRLVAKSPAK